MAGLVPDLVIFSSLKSTVMKKYIFLLPVLAISVFMNSCKSEEHESDEVMVKAANELDAKFVEAFNKNDANAVMALYWNSPDLVSFSPDGTEGANWEKAKQDLTKTFEMMKGAKLELLNSKNKAEGHVVLGHGNWTLTLADSANTKINGRYTDVKAKKDNKWVYIMDHGSVPLPPMQ
jgi:ketosteroid isomerase-like protein